MSTPVDRAELEESIRILSGWWCHGLAETFDGDDKRHIQRVCAAARAHLDTLPKTKMVEVRFVARVSADGLAVYYCHTDTPEHRSEIEQNIRNHGGQLVCLSGTAEVPAT
jgi:hypothetical protein